MRKELELKVIRSGCVDTLEYRYIVRDDAIMRIELDKLGTVAALHGWEMVKKLPV